VNISENLFFHETSLSGHQCFCTYNECDIRSMNSTRCEDIDECMENNSNCQQTYRNTAGSYLCECREGFMLCEDYHTCKDVDECQTNPCLSGQLCTNTYGSYYCLNVGGGSSGLKDAADSVAHFTGINMGTLVGASVLTAVVAVLGALAVFLGVRHYNKRNAQKKNLVLSPTGHMPSARNGDKFGFNSVSSKISAQPYVEEDALSTLSVDMNY
jgi:hypothetical protein